MLKPKVIFPERKRLESPYQLEDCQRRLRDIRRSEVSFSRQDDDHVAFCIRRVKSVAVPFPMVAYEIHGTLKRWGGTGTVIQQYRLQRLTMQVDTWAVLFIVVSLLSSVLLMLPTMMRGTDNSLWLLAILALAGAMGILPLMTWIKQTRALNVEREIDMTHTAIMSALGIEDDATA